ncbi:MAG: winged helix-turn-helix transcriptional regulator [Promethearchaeota archaeon]
MIFDPDNFKEFIELIPKIQNAVQSGIKREFEKYKTKGYLLKVENDYFEQYSELFSRKWTNEIVLTVNYLKEAYFNDLKNTLTLINSRMLTSRLNSLSKLDIIERIVNDTRPVRVSYKMTTFGENLVLFPLQY